MVDTGLKTSKIANFTVTKLRGYHKLPEIYTQNEFIGSPGKNKQQKQKVQVPCSCQMLF